MAPGGGAWRSRRDISLLSCTSRCCWDLGCMVEDSSVIDYVLLSSEARQRRIQHRQAVGRQQQLRGLGKLALPLLPGALVLPMQHARKRAEKTGRAGEQLFEAVAGGRYEMSLSVQREHTPNRAM